MPGDAAPVRPSHDDPLPRHPGAALIGPTVLLPILNAATYAGLAVVLGAAAVRYLVLPRSGLAQAERVPPLRAAATTAAFAAVVVLVAAPARLLLQVSQLADPGEAWQPLIQTILVDTSLGRALQLQAIWAAAALMAFTVARAGRERGWSAATISALVLSATPALAGHAAASESPLLAQAATTVHVLAAGIWLGTLFHLWRALRWVSASTVLAMVRSFHPLAVGAVGALVVSGAYQAWSILGTPGDLVGSPWGRWLLAKLALVAVVVLLGQRNWQSAEARLTAGDSGALRASFGRELVVAALVIALTGILASTATPG
ncbi:MAG: CopD family protein [Gemmatimonadales bacterium]|nr:CopD family protein [Gemmatimonadales bacterium]